MFERREVAERRVKPATRNQADDVLPAFWPRGNPRLHREVAWWLDDKHLGIIVLDLIDRDYGFVLLSRDPVEFLDAITSYPTQEQAEAKLHERAMHRARGLETHEFT